jgi:hypothetical protein
MEAEETVQQLGEMRDDLEEKLENLKNRLEKFDDVLRFENLVFGKNGTKSKFKKVLIQLRVIDLSNHEIDIIWNSFD